MSKLPNATHGLCHNCGDANRYTETNCSRCHVRLAWAFLIDGIDDTPSPSLLDRWMTRLFPVAATDNAQCRFCGEKIVWNARVCPHCEKLLAVGRDTSCREVVPGVGTLVDDDAPEMKRLIQRFLDELAHGRETP